MEHLNKWPIRWLTLAKNVADWSKDPSTGVGCVITKGKKLVNIGYNGFAAGVIDSNERLDDRETRLKLTIHSEINAILTAKQDLTGCTLYCTMPPCAHCASVIIQTGIHRVVCLEPNKEFAKRWEKDLALTNQIFSEAEIKYLILNGDLL